MTSTDRIAAYIRQELLDEHQGDIRLAFEDACLRLAIASGGLSFGAIRAGPPDEEEGRPRESDPNL